jgi:hypothetical protein
MITMISKDHATQADDRLTHGGLALRSIAQIIVTIGPDHRDDPEDRSDDPSRSSR